MRDLNLLPDWYPSLRRKRQMFVLQLVMSALLITAMMAWWGWSYRELTVAKGQLVNTRTELSEKQEEVAHLEQIVRLQDELVSKQSVMSQIGLPVEQSRVLGDLIEAMPGETWLTAINARTEERRVTAAELGLTSTRARGELPTTRRLSIRVEGLALSDADVMALFSTLSSNPVFEQVKLGGSSEVQYQGRAVRRFDMSFQIRLDVEAPKGDPA
jgi:Tfp pilus assembly protein PilN